LVVLCCASPASIQADHRHDGHGPTVRHQHVYRPYHHYHGPAYRYYNDPYYYPRVRRYYGPYYGVPGYVPAAIKNWATLVTRIGQFGGCVM